MKKTLSVLIVFLVCVSWVARFVYINQNTSKSNIIICDLNETVPIENDYMFEAGENMQGYEIMVKKSKIYDYEDYVYGVLNTSIEKLPNSDDKQHPPR